MCKVVICGDFNAHSTLWDKYDDDNGRVVEEFLEDNDLICLNDGRGTGFNVRNGGESAVDLTIASCLFAGKSTWEVLWKIP